jgi:diguanylate cyclase (GGDEF)-like protein/PAS domain S-box-containing protein
MIHGAGTQRDLETLNRALRLLSACNHTLFRAKDEHELLAEVCRLVVETGGYLMSWVGFACNDEAKSIAPAASYGYEDGYLHALNLTWSDTERGRAPTGAAIRSAKVQVNQNFLTNPTLAPWRKGAKERGYQSSIALPLIDSGVVLGALSIYSKKSDAFNPEEVDLLEELANDLAYGIITLRNRDESRQLRTDIRNAEAALQESREKYRQFVELTNEGIWSVDAELKMNYVNPALCRMLGYPHEEMLGRNVEDFAFDGGKEALGEQIWSRRAGHDSRAMVERCFRRKDGAACWVVVTATWLRDEHNVVLGGFAMITDITERKKVEQALADSQAQFEMLVRSAAIAINILHGDQFFYVNPAMEQLSGYSREELLTMRAIDILHPDSKQLITNRILARQRGEEVPDRYEFQLITKQGQTRWIDISASRIIYNGKSCSLGSLLDITDRKKAEEELQLASLVYQNTSEAMLITDRNNNIVSANPAFEKLSGYSLNEVRGKTPSTFRSGRHDKAFYRSMWDSLNSRGCWRGEISDRRKDGHVYIKQLAINTIKDRDGAVSKYIALFSDITERKLNESRIAESEKKFRLLFESANDSLMLLDFEGRIQDINRIGHERLGFSKEEMVGRKVSEFNAPDFIPVAPLRFKQIQQHGQSFFESAHLCKNGTVMPVEINARLIELGGQKRIFSVIRDVTERKKLEEELKLSALVLQNSSEGMLVTDENNLIIAVNPAFTDITGYTFAEVKGKNPRIFRSGRHDKPFYQAIWQAIITTGHWQGEIWDRRKNGEEHAKFLTINTIKNSDGKIHRYVALFSDITEKKKAEEMIWRQANFDSLTNLPNRQMFHDRLEQEVKKSRRSGLPIALLLVDLDRFKEVNDTLGHDKGDLLLIDAAQRITSCVRQADTVARLGGDEFIVILPELGDMASIQRIANNIIGKFTAPFQLGSDGAFVSASIGISLYPNDGKDLEDLLKSADQAMYAAKNAGRNRFSYFTPDLQEAAQKRLRLANDLRLALSLGQFDIHYQPIVELATGRIQKAEALIRWPHPVRGMVSPMDFIPIAEETGLIIQIGDWIFKQAVQQVACWRSTYDKSFQISINKSPVQIRHNDNTHVSWPAHLREQKIAGQAITVEITEGLLMNADPVVTDNLLSFRNAGMQVSIDDFGTGYSSLAYLKEFNIDYLKIDRSFIRNLGPNTSDLALCEAIVVMAHKLGMRVVAEGVETLTQRDLLRQIECDFAQGHLFSKPVPPEEFELLLQRESMRVD